MKSQKILLVEDQEKYRTKAQRALKGKDIIFATNYDEALNGLSSATTVITDVFFPQNDLGTSSDLEAKNISAIKYGLVKNYVQKMSDTIKKEAGIDIDDRLRKSLETIGYHKTGCSDNLPDSMSQAVSLFIKTFRTEASGKLEQAVNEMIGGTSERIINDLFNPLLEYMKKSPANQPLGYLVAEEAEKQGKPFVLVTSLSHSEGPLQGILRSVKARQWNILEGRDGSKDNPKYWMQAYNLIKGESK